jgi:hypothetical protein
MFGVNVNTVILRLRVQIELPRRKGKVLIYFSVLVLIDSKTIIVETYVLVQRFSSTEDTP